METRPSATARAVGVLLLLALILSACGGGGGEASSGGGGGEVMMEDEAESRADVPQSGGGSMMPSSGGGEFAAAEAGTSDDLSAPGDFDRKIVKTAELGVRAEHVRDAAASAQQVAAGYGGSVLSSRIEGGDGSVSADLVLLVPSPEFEAVIDELRGLGKEVTTDTVRGEDVTEEFVDLESRERNLLAAEASLLELYDRAESVSAALSIERELTTIRGEIELVQGRIQYLEDRTSSSRISLSIQPVLRAKPQPSAWSPARVVAQAWNASLGVLQALATAILAALVFGWWLAPLLVAGFVWWRRRARHPAATGSSEPG